MESDVGAEHTSQANHVGIGLLHIRFTVDLSWFQARCFHQHLMAQKGSSALGRICQETHFVDRVLAMQNGIL